MCLPTELSIIHQHNVRSFLLRDFEKENLPILLFDLNWVVYVIRSGKEPVRVSNIFMPATMGAGAGFEKPQPVILFCYKGSAYGYSNYNDVSDTHDLLLIGPQP